MHKPKRLLLVNLRELHSHFKNLPWKGRNNGQLTNMPGQISLNVHPEFSFFWKVVHSLFSLEQLVNSLFEIPWKGYKVSEWHRHTPLLLYFDHHYVYSKFIPLLYVHFLTLPTTCFLNDIESSVCNRILMIMHWIYVVRLLTVFSNMNKKILACKRTLL